MESREKLVSPEDKRLQESRLEVVHEKGAMVTFFASNGMATVVEVITSSADGSEYELCDANAKKGQRFFGASGAFLGPSWSGSSSAGSVDEVETQLGKKKTE